MTQYRYRKLATTEGVEQHSELGFRPESVNVDNLSASWAFIPSAGRSVPPFTYGATFPLVGAGQTADVLWQTPQGIPAPTPGVPLGQLTTIWSDAQLTPSNGQSVVTPTQQVVCKVASLTPGATTASVTNNVVTFDSGVTFSPQLQFVVNIPSGANSLILLGNFIYINNGNAPAPSAAVTVVGTQTNTRYLTTTSANPSPTPNPVLACIISPAGDSQCTVTLSFGTGFFGGNRITGTIEVVASFATQAVAVEPGGTPLATTLNGFDGFPFPTAGGSPVLPTVAWGNANMQVAPISTAINAAATLHVIAANAGVRLYLMNMTLVVREKANIQVAQLQDTSGNVVCAMQWDAGAGSNAPAFFDFKGVPLVTGRGLDLVNGGAAAASFLGCVTYIALSS